MFELSFATTLLKFTVVSFALGISFSLLASTIFFIINYINGTLHYLVKVVIITLLTVPLCFFLILGFPFILIQCIYTKIKNYSHQFFKKNQSRKEEKLISSESDVLVHLIHGTFGAKEAWIKEDSQMCKTIQNRCKVAKLTQFVWNGNNSHMSRREAAKKLHEKISNSGSNNHYIVAHSHAGNIVQSLTDFEPSVTEKIKGVFLLSTPFIFRANLERTGGQLTFSHVIGFVLLIQIIVATISIWQFGNYGSSTALVVFFVAMVLELFVARFFREKFTKEMQPITNKAKLSNVFIMQSIGDEADAGLRFISFLHESCFGLFSQLADANKLIREKINQMYIICYLLQITVLVVLCVRGEPEELSILVILSLIGIAIVHLLDKLKFHEEFANILMLASLPVGIAAYYLNIIKAVVYGDLRLIFCPNIFVYSSETPAGLHKIHKYAPISDGSLVHSTHSNQKVIDDIAEIIANNFTLQSK